MGRTKLLSACTGPGRLAKPYITPWQGAAGSEHCMHDWPEKQAGAGKYGDWIAGERQHHGAMWVEPGPDRLARLDAGAFKHCADSQCFKLAWDEVTITGTDTSYRDKQIDIAKRSLECLLHGTRFIRQVCMPCYPGTHVFRKVPGQDCIRIAHLVRLGGRVDGDDFIATCQEEHPGTGTDLHGACTRGGSKCTLDRIHALACLDQGVALPGIGTLLMDRIPRLDAIGFEVNGTTLQITSVSQFMLDDGVQLPWDYGSSSDGDAAARGDCRACSITSGNHACRRKRIPGGKVLVPQGVAIHGGPVEGWLIPVCPDRLMKDATGCRPQ